MPSRRVHLRPWMLVSAAWIIPAVFAAVDRLAQGRINGWRPATPRELLFASGDWFLYAFFTPLVFLISARWPLTKPHVARRTSLHVTFALLFCVVWATSGKIFQMVLGLLLDRRQLFGLVARAGDAVWITIIRDWASWVFTTLPFGVAVYLCVVGVEHAVRYFTEASERELQVARLSEQLAGARFSALQAQLNPHFLFNTLNTIAVRARDGDGPGTARMVEQLSDVLRRTLDRGRANEVPLAEELDLVRQYLAIEQARFSDRLRPDFNVDDSLLRAALPSFALQHLVENAIRHGISRRPGAGALHIDVRRDADLLEVSVTDDGIGIDEATAPPAGHGIDNTRERLHALFGHRASLTVVRAAPFGTIATLRVPYHELPDAENDGPR